MNRTITDFRKTDSVKKKKRYLKLLKSVRTQRRVICEQNARIYNLEEKNTQLSEQYSTISNAFFWRVTGPVRFVLDVVKMVAHSHNAKTLIRNGLHSLMKEGVGVTREKVQNYQVNDSFIKVAVLSGGYARFVRISCAFCPLLLRVLSILK